jgi:toxin ParE1/3/4
MRIVFSALAERDLEEIADYIAEDNPQRAATFIAELRVHGRTIAAAPLAWPARPELGAGIRASLHGRYVIFFREDAGHLLIVRILHGARDLSAQFGGTPE